MISPKRGYLFIISGPSGAGKGSVISAASKKIDISLSVSVTDRSKRKHEKSNKDYYFVDTETFNKMVKEGKLLEWVELYGYKYGTPRDYVNKKLSQGEDIFLEIDVQGAKQVKKRLPDSILIFISPPSIQELEERLLRRATESREAIERRVRLAKDELAATDLYDYVIVNDKLENAEERLIKIIEEVRHGKQS